MLSDELSSGDELSMTKLEEFWTIVQEVWQNGAYGVDVGRIAGALGILLVFIALRRLFTRVVISRLRGYVSKTETQADDRALDALEKPVSFLSVVLGIFLATEYVEPDGAFADIANNLVRSLVAFTLFWAMHRLVDPLSFLLSRVEKAFSHAMVEWSLKLIKVLVIFVGAEMGIVT